MTKSPVRPPVRVAALGDVMMDRDVGRRYMVATDEFAMPDIRLALSGADLILANLENPVAVGGRADRRQDPHVTFRAAPATVDVLKSLGVHVVALANNHILDYGPDALAETIERLDAVGIKHVGAGRSYAEANAPLLLDVQGRRLAVLSYAFIYSVNTRMASRTRAGVSDHRIERILPLIRDLDADGYDVVVTLHWGFEYTFFPLPYQMRQARQMIDRGARMVLGHGPHYPQGIEEYRARDIIYSLGNFLFDEPYEFANWAYIYRAEIDEYGNTQNRQLVPIGLRSCVPHVLIDGEEQRVRELVNGLSHQYRHTTRQFWGAHSRSYLRELFGRCWRGRSLKYLRVPPLSFYRDIGPAGIVGTIASAFLDRLARRAGGAGSVDSAGRADQ